MITLTTGTPGSGKSLYTIHYVKQLAEKESRAVYYHGIKDLTLPWTLMDDPKEWDTLPTGSIIVIDECQGSFRPRGAGSQVPAYIAAMETHRHKGYDIFLITQHPALVDQNIRRLVGQHWHIVRKFGVQVATVHKWGSTHEITKNNLLQAVRENWRYSKEAMTYYKSAEVHTHKASIPKRVWFLAAAPVIIGVLGYLAYQTAMGISVHDTIEQQTATIQPAQSGSTTGAGQRVAPLNLAAWHEQQAPRVPGMPWTAPAYDPVTTPKAAPYPVACMSSTRHGCRCYDQQENRIAVTEGFCSDFIERGMFVSWRDDDGKRSAAASGHDTKDPTKINRESHEKAM